MRSLLSVLTVVALMLVVYLPKVNAGHGYRMKSVTTYRGNVVSSSISSTSAGSYAVCPTCGATTFVQGLVSIPDPAVSRSTVIYSVPRSQSRGYTRWKSYSRSR